MKNQHNKPKTRSTKPEHPKQKGIFNAYLRWRKKHPEATGFTDKEIEALRNRTPLKLKHSVWNEKQ